MEENRVKWAVKLSSILSSIPTNSAFIEEITIALHSLTVIAKVSRNNENFNRLMEDMGIPKWYITMVEESAVQGNRLDQLSAFALTNLIETVCWVCSREKNREIVIKHILQS